MVLAVGFDGNLSLEWPQTLTTERQEKKYKTKVLFCQSLLDVDKQTIDWSKSPSEKKIKIRITSKRMWYQKKLNWNGHSKVNQKGQAFGKKNLIKKYCSVWCPRFPQAALEKWNTLPNQLYSTDRTLYRTSSKIRKS